MAQLSLTDGECNVVPSPPGNNTGIMLHVEVNHHAEKCCIIIIMEWSESVCLLPCVLKHNNYTQAGLIKIEALCNVVNEKLWCHCHNNGGSVLDITMHAVITCCKMYNVVLMTKSVMQ